MLQCQYLTIGDMLQCQCLTIGDMLQCQCLTIGDMLQCQCLTTGDMLQCQSLTMSVLFSNLHSERCKTNRSSLSVDPPGVSSSWMAVGVNLMRTSPPCVLVSGSEALSGNNRSPEVTPHVFSR